MGKTKQSQDEPMKDRTDGWDMLFVSLLGHILPERQREEWLGDLKEARASLIYYGWSRWVVALMTLLRLCLLLWSLLRIKYQDLGLCTNSEPLETESFPMDTELIRRLAMSKATVLIPDYRTVLKERIARAIHLHGQRRREPFIALNCAAISKDMIEKRLFGEMKGLLHRTGCLQQANHGTLFLDGIDDLPLDVQVKLLRFIHEKTLTPVGGSTAIEVEGNVRLIAASTRDLTYSVKQSRFREDLYYRLNVIALGKDDIREKTKAHKKQS